MHKLDELVASMNFHDQKAFVNYLRSPYFTSNSLLETLFREVTRRVVSEKKPESALVSLPAVKRKALTAQKLRYLQTDLVRHLEYFFTLRHLDRQSLQLDVIKLQALSERDCEKSWSYIHSELTGNTTLRNFDFHLTGFAVAENRAKFLSAKLSRKKAPEFENVMYHLDAFYFSKKLQLFCEMINMKNLIANEAELTFFNEVKSQAVQFMEEPAVKIYYSILLTLTEPDNESHFTHARSVITALGKLFPAKELNEIFFYIKNYCIRKINKGKPEYMVVLFEIYKEIISNKRLMSLDYLSQFEFKNIVSLSLRLKENEWCKEFIGKRIALLPPGDRDNSFAYNTAYLNFMTGNYKNAVRLLQEVEFTDVVYQLDARVILLKCYFEMDDEETFFYHASAFRLFLLRNRHISDYQKTINRNLIRHLVAIMRNRHSIARMKKVKAAILKDLNVADVKWLMEKLDLY
ncbi:MAG: hypothetical protein M3Q95_11910 [Bacteroidota bacterium]|nr:hypothetical protein [Bacteroidota bacterium]